MERNIQWNSGCFDEIVLVYNKAEVNELTARILSDLEVGALAEARSCCGVIQKDGSPITPEAYDDLSEQIKEQLIATLSIVGLSSFSPSLTEPKIVVRLSSQFQQTRCCTAFLILNRLEKLDGAFNVLYPQATLEIQAPLGGKDGLLPIELLISQLYPWLKVIETSSNEIAAKLPQSQQYSLPKQAERLSTNTAPVPNQQKTTAAQNNKQSASKGIRKVKKFSVFALVIAVIALLILVKGATMVYSSIQPATTPQSLSSISGKQLTKGDCYCGQIRILRPLGYIKTKGNGVTLTKQVYLAAFEDKNAIWNYVIFEPQPTRPIVGDTYSGCFVVEERNKTITDWKDNAITSPDNAFFEANVTCYDTGKALRGNFATVKEYMKDYNDYQIYDILGAVVVVAIGLVGLFLAWKAHKSFT